MLVLAGNPLVGCFRLSTASFPPSKYPQKQKVPVKGKPPCSLAGCLMPKLQGLSPLRLHQTIVIKHEKQVGTFGGTWCGNNEWLKITAQCFRLRLRPHPIGHTLGGVVVWEPLSRLKFNIPAPYACINVSPSLRVVWCLRRAPITANGPGE